MSINPKATLGFEPAAAGRRLSDELPTDLAMRADLSVWPKRYRIGPPDPGMP